MVLNKLNFRARLVLLVGLVLALMAITAVLTLGQLQRVAAAIDSVYKDRLVPMQQLRQVSLAYTVELPSVARRLAAGRLAVLQSDAELAAIEQTMGRNWADYRATYLVPREEALIAETEPLLALGLQRIAQLRKLSRSADAPELGRFEAEQLQPLTADIARKLSALIDVQLDVGRREASDSAQAFERAVWLVLALLVLAVGLSAWLGWSLWRQHASEHGEVEAQRQRLQRFYRALSETNQMIVRAPGTAQRLYQGLCRICVETGAARMAVVVLSDGEHFERVAHAGPVDELMPALPERWRFDAPFALAEMSSAAMQAGEPVLSNRAIGDARLPMWLSGRIPPGIESMAALPLRRDGRLIGALCLLAGEAGFFAPDLLELLGEMAGDVSFALDNLDREQARREALALAQKERALFELLFNASAIGCMVATLPEGRVMEINEVMCRRYGYTHEELVGRRTIDMKVGLSPADRVSFYGRMAAEGQVRNFEAEILTRDGPRYSLVNGDVIDYGGQTCVLASSIDITELRTLRGQTIVARHS